MGSISMEAEILDLWGRKAPALRRFFRMALNGNVEAAEDLTAETFTMLVEAFGRGPVNDSAALLRTIAKRRLTNELRRRLGDLESPSGLVNDDEHDHLLRFQV